MKLDAKVEDWASALEDWASSLERVPLDPLVRRVVLQSWQGKCGYCGDAPAEHVDHIVPRAKGGPDAIENYVAACVKCNLKKSDTMPAFFGIIIGQATNRAPKVRQDLQRARVASSRARGGQFDDKCLVGTREELVERRIACGMCPTAAALLTDLDDRRGRLSTPGQIRVRTRAARRDVLDGRPTRTYRIYTPTDVRDELIRLLEAEPHAEVPAFRSKRPDWEICFSVTSYPKVTRFMRGSWVIMEGGASGWLIKRRPSRPDDGKTRIVVSGYLLDALHCARQLDAYTFQMKDTFNTGEILPLPFCWKVDETGAEKFFQLMREEQLTDDRWW